MAQDGGGGVLEEGGLHHFPGVNAGPVNRPPEQLLEGDNPMPVVQPENGKDFVFEVRQFEPEILLRGGGGGYLRALAEPGVDLADRRLDDLRAGGQAVLSGFVLDHQGPEIELLLQHGRARTSLFMVLLPVFMVTPVTLVKARKNAALSCNPWGKWAGNKIGDFYFQDPVPINPRVTTTL